MAVRKTKTKTAPRGRAAKAIARVSKSELALPESHAEKFAKFMKRDKASAAEAGWPYVSTAGSLPVMTLGDRELGDGDGALTVIVLAARRVNSYFADPYEQGVMQVPSCGATAGVEWEGADVESQMAPPADLKTKEADTCKDCEFNAFGSAIQGKGKACKNTVRLACLLPETATKKDGLAKAEGVLISVPVASVKSWAKYVAHVNGSYERPVNTVFTTITKVLNPKTAGFTFNFDMAQDKDGKPAVINTPDELDDIFARTEGDGLVAVSAVVENRADEDAPSKKAAGKKGPRRQKVVRKGGRRRKASGRA